MMTRLPVFLLLLTILAGLLPGNAVATADDTAPGKPDVRTDAQVTDWSDLLPRNADADPRAMNTALQGRNIRISGFVVPLERDDSDALTDFLLVPYFGACIHVPPPPQNQIIQIHLRTPAADMETMDTVWVEGTLQIDTGAGEASYVMQDAALMRENRTDWQKTGISVLLTLLCGLSVSLGWVGPFAGRPLRDHVVTLALSLAAGMLAGLGVSSVLAEPVQGTYLLFAGGFALSVLLLHVHTSAHRSSGNLGVAFGIALHNYPECFLVLSISMADPAMGCVLALAMLAHNVPLGISLALAQGASQNIHGRLKACIAGVLPPVLALLTFWIARSVISPDNIRALMAAAGGILAGLGLTELLPHACRHGSRRTVVLGFVGGILLLVLIMALFYRSSPAS